MNFVRVSPEGRRQRVTVPRHRELVRKTLFDIYKQTCRYIPEEELRPYFYTD